MEIYNSSGKLMRGSEWYKRYKCYKHSLYERSLLNKIRLDVLADYVLRLQCDCWRKSDIERFHRLRNL
jgi:hypothetical protein